MPATSNAIPAAPFVVVDVEAGFVVVSRHKSEATARKAAWRLAHAQMERSAWRDLDEAALRDGVLSIGMEREAIAWFGRGDAVQAEIDELGIE